MNADLFSSECVDAFSTVFFKVNPGQSWFLAILYFRNVVLIITFEPCSVVRTPQRHFSPAVSISINCGVQ